MEADDLSRVGEWLIECGTGGELLERVRAFPGNGAGE